MEATAAPKTRTVAQEKVSITTCNLDVFDSATCGGVLTSLRSFKMLSVSLFFGFNCFCTDCRFDCSSDENPSERRRISP